MRVAYIDHLSGLTGSMLLAALVDAGARCGDIEAALRGWISIDVTLSAKTARRRGIVVSEIEISTADTAPSLSLEDLLAMSRRHPLSQRVSAIWSRLFDAEASARNSTADRLTLADIGGTQVLVEIMGVCEAVAQLRIDRIYCPPVPLSADLDESAPAVSALATGFPVRPAGPSMPVTSAGMALLTSLVDVFSSPPAFTLLSTGYGGQGTNRPDETGLIRVCLGGMSSEAPEACGDIVVVETNIDDMNPQYYGYVVDLLLERGALDAYLVPVIMKKGRPGTLLAVLVEQHRVNDITSTILRETTTIGIRMYTVQRRTLSRRIIGVDTVYGSVRIKVVRHGAHVRFTPEYDDCLDAARTHGIPLSDVYDAVRTAANRLDLGGML